MITFPSSTYFNKRIPKERFYSELTISPALKKLFVDQVKNIFWANKIASSTLNIEQGKTVTEIEVFLIRLKEKKLNEAVLKQIDKEIPYHILFVLEYEGEQQLCICYKEAVSGGKNAFVLNRYYYSEWLKLEEHSLKINGLSTDTIYENFIRQIAGGSLENKTDTTIKEDVELSEKKSRLQKDIEKFEKQARSEKQPKRKLELAQRVQHLKDELNSLK